MNIPNQSALVDCEQPTFLVSLMSVVAFLSINEASSYILPRLLTCFSITMRITWFSAIDMFATVLPFRINMLLDYLGLKLILH